MLGESRESGNLRVWESGGLCIDLCELVVADERSGPDTPTGEGSADFKGKVEGNVKGNSKGNFGW